VSRTSHFQVRHARKNNGFAMEISHVPCYSQFTLSDRRSCPMTVGSRALNSCSSHPGQRLQSTDHRPRLLPGSPLPVDKPPKQRVWVTQSFLRMTVDLSIKLDSVAPSSSLLHATPSLCPASVLGSSWGFHLDVSLGIGATGSHVPHKSLKQGHAASMPTPSGP